MESNTAIKNDRKRKNIAKWIQEKVTLNKSISIW